MGDVIALSLTASLNPTLVAVTTVMLLLDGPKRLMAGYLLGAFAVSITLGLVIVFAIPGSGATKTTQHTLSPLADVVLGALALTLALVVNSGRHERMAARRRARKAAKGPPKPPRWQRALNKGSARTTFLIGMVLTLPGASYLLGLHTIRGLHYATAVTVLIVVAFNVVMLWLLEVPLAFFVVAPESTPHRVAAAKAWVGRHAEVFAVRGLAGVGALLVVKGVVGLIA